MQWEKATASSPQLLQADLDVPLLCAFGVCLENADCKMKSMAKECKRKGWQGKARQGQAAAADTVSLPASEAAGFTSNESWPLLS